jgi:putative acetyltransferase
MLIHEETEKDYRPIAAVNRRAFGGDYEVNLIAKLREERLVIASLVGVEDDKIVGHIMFSHLTVEIDGRQVRAAALAPMAVRPTHQRKGIGSKLVAKGLEQMREKMIEAVLVLGHKNYYPRFGFSAEHTRKLVSPFPGMAQFMGLELVPGALAGKEGFVRYPAAFGLNNQPDLSTISQRLPRGQRLAPEP